MKLQLASNVASRYIASEKSGYTDIHLLGGVYGIYQPPIEQSDWQDATAMVQQNLIACIHRLLAP